MRPIVYFPFTYYTQGQIDALTAFFPGLECLVLDREMPAPLARAVTAGTLAPVRIDSAEIERAEQTVTAFQAWAALHKGNEKNLRALLRDTPYFTDDTGVASLTSQIRKGLAPEQVADSGPGSENADARSLDQGGTDPVAFLKFAQIWDAENLGIQAELDAVDAGNAVLLAELKGEEPVRKRTGALPLAFDPGTAMPGERIRYWAMTARRSGLLDKADIPLFVTTSPGILDYLSANSDQVINGLDIESIKVHDSDCANREAWQTRIMEILDSRISGRISQGASLSGDMPGASDPCTGTGRIRLCIFPDGVLSTALKIPGKPIAVCLVQLNS